MTPRNAELEGYYFIALADGSERPILNISKILSATQRRYSQIQKEALSLVYALRKFHQFLYGRKFIVVTDHKPLVTLFAPDKGTPPMAANRFARWALLVHQYDHTVEYSNDTSFDGEEMEEDVDSVCLVRTINRQINPDNPLLVVRETAKDPILSQVMRFVKDGWPNAFSEELKDFKKLENLLSTENGCVLYGIRVIIPSTSQLSIKVYWPTSRIYVANALPVANFKISQLNLQSIRG